FHAWNDSLRRCVGEHGNETGFTFTVAPTAIMEMPDSDGLPAPWIFFHRYLNPIAPSHILSFGHGQFVALTVADWIHDHGRLPGPFPHLVQIGSEYHLFQNNQQYHVVRRQDAKRYLASLGDVSWVVLRDVSLCRIQSRMDAWLIRDAKPGSAE